MTARPARPVATLLLAVSTVGIPSASAAAPQEDFFLEGNRLYQEGNYRGALESYRRIEEAGFASGPLFYNMGNAHFKLAELGPAILYYERALRLMPGDDDLRANLELARSLTADDVLPLPGFLPFRVARWWVYLFPPSWLTWIVGVAYVTAMTALIVRVLRPSPAVAGWARPVAALAGLVTLVFGLNLAARELGLGDPPRAVVMAEAADVQSAPSPDPSLKVFTVHEGTTVRIGRRAEGWAEVVLADGQVGWVRLDDLEQI